LLPARIGQLGLRVCEFLASRLDLALQSRKIAVPSGRILGCFGKLLLELGVLLLGLPCLGRHPVPRCRHARDGFLDLGSLLTKLVQLIPRVGQLLPGCSLDITRLLQALLGLRDIR
jgi:hypothetical protein